MNIKEPLVSIITPAYNAETYIKEAIQSVLNQTYTNWELIIINDGSKDRTEEIIKSFNDLRIILFSQKNSGVSTARNKGLQLAKGKYITFLDADDILPPQSLKVRVEFLQHNPKIDLVDGKINIFNQNIQNIIREYQPYYLGNLLPKLLKLDDKVFFNVCYFFKKDILNNTSFKKTMTHAEDLLFYIEIASKQNVIYGFVQDEIYYYRVGHTSAMTNLDGLEIGYLKLIDEVKKVQSISKIDFFIFKTKIAKIIFLSWIHQKKIIRAVRSIFYIYQIIRKEFT